MDKTNLTDEAIGTLIDSKIRDTTTWYNSKLSKEREQVIEYYNGDLPLRQKEGSSSYITNDVYDSVEGLKAQLLETFASGYQIVKFDAQNPQDVQPAHIATLYSDYVMFRQNDGYRIFQDVVHDGLTARVGIVKVWWDECSEYQDEEFEHLPEDHVNALAGHDEVADMDATANEDTGLYSGKLSRKIDKSQVVIEAVNPEEFSVERQAKDINSGDYFTCHSTYKTKAELERLGYDKDKIKKIAGSNDLSVDLSPERLARFKDIDTSINLKGSDDQDEKKHVLVHECYIKLVRKGTHGREKLFKVVRAGSVTLDIEEVDDVPFVAFVPIPTPHSFYGVSFAQKVIQIQNSRSTLTRQIIDHANITNNPRYTVVRGGLTNPRELLDNRLGGIVNVSRPDAVAPLPQYGLNPFVFQTLAMIEQNNEKTTGVSSLSQGLNKDAISNQNSQGMVNDLVNLSQTRQKVIARNFANNFLVPLYLRIYKLVIENEKKQNIVELAGDWTQVTPSQWSERKMCTCSFHLGYGEQDREADKRIQLFMGLRADQDLRNMVQPQNAYKFAVDTFRMKGIGNVNDYLTAPDKVPPKAPDPKTQAETQKVQNDSVKAQAAMLTAQTHQAKVMESSKIAEVKMAHQIKQDKAKVHLSAADEQRKHWETSNHIDISQREMHLAEVNPAKDEAIVSPNG